MTELDLHSLAPGLQRQGDIWYTRATHQVSYPESGHDRCYDLEDESFWFQHRNLCIWELYRKNAQPGTFLDVGGGNGFVTRMLAERDIPSILLEPGHQGIHNASQRGLKNLVCGSLEDLAFVPGAIANLALFDVIEHLADERPILRQACGVLGRQGRIFITVPAYRWLWCHEDNYSGHYRRYTLRTLRQVLRECGFEVIFASYFFSILPLPIAILRSLPYRLGRPDPTAGQEVRAREHKGLATRLIQWAIAWEPQWLARGRGIPVGSSCALVARPLT